MRELPAPPRTGDDALDAWLQEARRILKIAGPVECMFGWVADNKQTCFLGTLPCFSYVLRVQMHCTELFNSDAADEVSIGWTGDTDALATATDVSAAGVLAPALGANAGYNATEQDVNAYYVNGGSEPTQGKCLCVVEFIRVPIQIS